MTAVVVTVPAPSPQVEKSPTKDRIILCSTATPKRVLVKVIGE
jgi:hypothetical protein